MGKVKTVWEDCDILVVGGGMAGTGAAYEIASCLVGSEMCIRDRQ